MSKVRIPGFTAEASLRRMQKYNLRSHAYDEKELVLPQFSACFGLFLACLAAAASPVPGDEAAVCAAWAVYCAGSA
jgi:hypothetical protein